MTKIIKSMDPQEYWSILENEEKKGKVSIHRFVVGDKAKKAGLIPAPHNQAIGYKVEVGGVTGFLYRNPMHDYYHADFYPESECTDLGEVGKELPCAIEKEKKAESVLKKSEAHQERVKASHKRMAISNVARVDSAFAKMKQVNEICSLPVFDIPSDAQSYRESMLSDNGLNTKFSLGRHERVSGVILNLVEQSLTKTGILPVLTTFNQEDTELQKGRQILAQLQDHLLASDHAITFDIAMTGNKENPGNIVIAIFEYNTGEVGQRIGLWEMALRRSDVACHEEGDVVSIKSYTIDTQSIVRCIEGGSSINPEESHFLGLMQNIEEFNRFALQDDYNEYLESDTLGEAEFDVIAFDTSSLLRCLDVAMTTDQSRNIVEGLTREMIESPDKTPEMAP